ncbi:hypothetical protein OSTOST_05643 [Ostertagia ostertagi]
MKKQLHTKEVSTLQQLEEQTINAKKYICHFHQNSERNQADVEEKEALVASVKQLIETTEKNRKLTKENEKILNQSHVWHEEKSNLEKQVKESNALVEALQNQLKEKCAKIELLELRITDLLKSVTEHPSEEVFEASEEMRVLSGSVVLTKKKELKEVQMLLQEVEEHNRFLDAENKELRCKLENLHSVMDEVATLRGRLDNCNQKVTFLEGENLGLQKEEEELMKKVTAKTEEATELKEKCERLDGEIETLRGENAGFSQLRLQNEKLERSLEERERDLDELRRNESELKSRISSCMREIEDLKCNDAKLNCVVNEKVDEADKLREECKKLREVSSKLTEENVFSSVLSEELRMRLSRANADLDELRLSLANEKQAREAAEENLRRCSDLEMKLRERSVRVDDLITANEKMSQELEYLRQLRERSVRVDDLITANEKMSQELEYLRQAAANSSSKEETQRLSDALRECRENLERAIAEKKVLMEKEVANAEQIAKVESLRYELKCRDEIVADLRSVEAKLQDALVEKSAEITNLGHRLDKINDECDRVREDFRVFQELAEQQYCEMVEEKRGQIDALSYRLAQLESYPVSDERTEGFTRSIYDYISPAVRELAEKAATESPSVAEAIREMREIFVAIPTALPTDNDDRQGSPPLPLEKCNVETQTSVNRLEEEEGELPISRLITSVENFRDPDSYPSSSYMQDELKRLLTCAKREQRSTVIDTAVVHFLKECHQHFSDAAERARQELRAICDDKEILEKRISSEKLKWNIEREDLQLQLDRFRRQADQVTSVQRERMSVMSELNAAKIQIEQYRVKLRKQSEEMEAISAERDNAAQLMIEFQKLDQESQDEVRKANSIIDELQKNLEDARADLEKEKREVISLKDENDKSLIAIQYLRNQVTDLEQRVVDLERRCEKLLKTERYNQKTIQIVCESFWEREEFVQRLRRRSYERKIESWTKADVRDDMDHDSKTSALRATVEKLGSGEQFNAAHKRMLSRITERS